MRRPTDGVLPMNISLSISYDASTNFVYGLLLGCSREQGLYIIEQLRRLSGLAEHPLLLPILLSGIQQRLISEEVAKLWKELLDVESHGGRSGITIVGVDRVVEETAQESITEAVLSVLQLATAWESEARALLFGLELMEEILSNKAAIGIPAYLSATSKFEILRESVQLISQRTKIVLWDIEFIEKRASAQMDAVSRSLTENTNSNISD